MRKLFRDRVVIYLSMCILYTGTLVLMDIGRGRDIDFSGKIISGIMFVIIMALFQTMIDYSVFSRIKYLENNDISKPTIKGASSSEIVLSNRVDFSRLKSKIASKWLITYFDDTSHVMKFRKKVNYFTDSWGIGRAAAWLKLDDVSGKIHLECFPMSGIQDKKHALKMRTEVEELIETL